MRFDIPSIILELCIRLFNAVCGGLLGMLVFGLARRFRLWRALEVDPNIAINVLTIGCALLGLIWGKHAWKAFARVHNDGWGPKV